MPSIDCDIAIVGGGLVGAAFALSLNRSRFQLALIESAAPAAPAGWDSRIYALSPASRRFLGDVGAWDRLDLARIQPVRRMLVRGDTGGQLEFSAYETGVSELALIVEAGALARALWRGLQDQDNIELLCPASPERLEREAQQVMLWLQSGDAVRARLVVGADGARSFVRREAGLRAQAKPYGQLGVVANFACARPHRGTAFQWFRHDGVLAWLPLPGRRFSMVWSTAETHARELLELGEAAFCRVVAEAGGHDLGELSLVTAPAAFPISGLKLDGLIADRIALMGDAAHVVHPLAGQGVNLGFSDAADLGEILRGHQQRDPGDVLMLRRYERARSEEIMAMRSMTHGLARLFEQPGWQGPRNWGLNSVNQIPVLKTLLARHALGRAG